MLAASTNHAAKRSTSAREEPSRLRGLELTDPDVGGLHERAAVLDAGVLEVDVAVGEVGLELEFIAFEELALDAQTRGADFSGIVAVVEVVIVVQHAAVDQEASEHVCRPAAVLAREGRPRPAGP